MTTRTLENTAPANSNARPRRVRFRLAGYTFTYCRTTAQAKVRIDMWREDPVTSERHWVTVAACAPTRESARSVALALVAWVRWCDVGPKRDAQSQAVAESFALLRDRLTAKNPSATGTVRTRPTAVARPATQATPPGAGGDTHGCAA